MSVVGERYDELREAGFDHGQAAMRLAGEIGVDLDTIRRVLARAGRKNDSRVSAPLPRGGSAPSGPPHRR